jgi:GNAT superfamily N-acetyltransferase
MHIEWRRDDGYVISTDPARLDLDGMQRFLERSYWAGGIPRDLMERALANSLPFGIYDANGQVGFARVISDHATFGYLADVFVLPAHRGKGLSKWLMECVLAHPELQGFRRWVLVTRDAHGLYRHFGFHELEQPDRYMELRPRRGYR